MDGVGDVAASNHAVLSREQAASFGLHSQKLRRLKRRGILREPVPGVLVVHGSTPTWRQQLAVATTAARAQAVASHRAAARLHRLDGFPSDVVEVTVPRGALAHVPGLVRHQVATALAEN